jgi:hypothetical protein
MVWHMLSEKVDTAEVLFRVRLEILFLYIFPLTKRQANGRSTVRPRASPPTARRAEADWRTALQVPVKLRRSRTTCPNVSNLNVYSVYQQVLELPSNPQTVKFKLAGYPRRVAP